MMKKDIIFINPWIYDFAAYDLWSKPMGLLYLASYLGRCGFNVRLLDCLDIHNPYMKETGLRRPKRRLYGTGRFWKQMISLPHALNGMKRPYSRYGITPEIFIKELTAMGKPDAFIVTSMMTYWYPGVIEAIKSIKGIYPDVPVLLGGIYTRLCNKHAILNSGADVVINSSEPASILQYLKEFGIYPEKRLKFDPSVMYPSFELYRKLDYVCIMSSKGCPYRCRYCAGPYLNPNFCAREPEDVFEEICFWHKRFGIVDFAFYDDALLVSAKDHLLPLLEMVIRKGLNIRFHTPNAIHIREVNKEVADLMFRAGFKTIRLGLETIDMDLHKRLDKKLGTEDIGDIEKHINYLFEAGFKSPQIGAYILIGLPGQDISSIMDTIKFSRKMKIMPFLAEYSPIPHTPLWKDAVESSPFDLEAEPLYHNNILIPCWDEDKKKEVPKLKSMVVQTREEIRADIV